MDSILDKGRRYGEEVDMGWNGDVFYIECTKKRNGLVDDQIKLTLGAAWIKIAAEMFGRPSFASGLKIAE